MNQNALRARLVRVRKDFRLSHLEQMLFHELIYVAYREGGKEVFTCSNYTLCNNLRIGEKKLASARKKLSRAGLIRYVSKRATREAGVYSLIVNDGTSLPAERPVETKVALPAERPVETADNNSIDNINNKEIDKERRERERKEQEEQERQERERREQEERERQEREEKERLEMEAEAKAKALFETFRKEYPGTKRGLDTEYEYLRKKHPDYREVVKLFMPALQNFKKWRRIRLDRGEFAPEYPHLKTWICNRNWEEERQKNNVYED